MVSKGVSGRVSSSGWKWRIVVGDESRVPKFAVDLCKLIGFDAGESFCITRGDSRRAYQQQKPAYSCLSESDSSVLSLPRRRAIVSGQGGSRVIAVKTVACM